MSRDGVKLIGFIIGREREMPDEVMRLITDSGVAQAELVKLGGTFLDDTIDYDVIIDRMSHEIPYYRTYVKFAAVNGCYVINDPFVWANDTKFLAASVLRKLARHSLQPGRVEGLKEVKGRKKRNYCIRDAASIEEKFKARNLTDTQWVTRLLADELKRMFPAAEGERRIFTRPGSVTSISTTTSGSYCRNCLMASATRSGSA